MAGPENPYKPPVTSAAPPVAQGFERPRQRFGPDELEEARRRLREHCQDAAALAADREIEGAPIRPLTIVMGLIFLICAGGTSAGIMVGDQMFALALIGGILGVVFFAIALTLLVNNLRIGKRTRATEPQIALRNWFIAAKTAHAGYAFTALAPTAREGTVAAPTYENEPPSAQFSTRDKAGIKKYLKSWARPDNKMVRWIQIKKFDLVEQDGDVARVRAQLVLTAWPQWANILSVVAFLLIRLIGIVLWIVLYYALRKVRKLDVEKTLLRGDDGLWYLLDADLRR